MTMVTMGTPSPSFGGQMYGMSGSGPPASCTRSGMATTTTKNPTGVAVGGGLTRRTKVVAHVIGRCGFSHDSTIVEYIDQQQRENLEHVVTVELEEFKDIHTVKSDGYLVKARPSRHIFPC
jgi:hypothetical protein